MQAQSYYIWNCVPSWFLKQALYMQVNNWYRIWTSIILLQFQKDFSMAISSLLTSGIYQKIEKDITTSTAYRGYFDNLWTREQLLANKPLTMDHVLPSFIMLGLGLIPAILIFFLELFHHKKKNANQAVL